MELNDRERGLVTAAVAAFHTKWRTRVNDRELVISAGGFTCLVGAGIVIAIIIKFAVAPVNAFWWQLPTLVGLLAAMHGFSLWRMRQWKKVLDDNCFHTWLQEIENVWVAEYDRQKLLSLIFAWPDGPLHGSLRRVLEVSQLRSLSFVRELRKYMRMP